MDQPGLYIQALFPLVSHLCCFISLLRVSFIGLFHVVQEIRLRSDYREIILLKKKKEVGEGQQTLCSCYCHAEGDVVDLRLSWGSQVRALVFNCCCLNLSVLCTPKLRAEWGEGREGCPLSGGRRSSFSSRLRSERVVIIKSRKCFQHSTSFHSTT